MVIYITGLDLETQERLYQDVKGKKVGIINGKPTYEEVQEIRKKVTRIIVGEKEIGEQLRNWLGDGYTTIEVSNIIKEARDLRPKVSKLTRGVQENLYTQLYILIKREKEIIKDRGVLIFKGHPDKYELLILEVLTKLGVTSIIENYGAEVEVEKMIEIDIKYHRGGLHEPLEVVLRNKKENDIESKNIVNKEIRVEESPQKMQKIIDHIDSDTRSRKTKEGKYKVNHIEICGVGIEDMYTRILTEFKEELEINPREFKILEQGIVTPTITENKALDTESVQNGTIIKDIMKAYPVVSDSDTIRLVERKFEEEVSRKKISGAVLNNYTRVMSVWLKRVMEQFYKEITIEEIPIVVIWGEITEREERFIDMLTVLPMDILHLAPTQQQAFKYVELEKYIVGADKSITGGYPRNTKMYRQKTQTYEAKEEIQELLYDGTLGLYQQMQFDRVKAKVMRATQDDLKIMWKEPMKMRTPFDTRYGIVEVSNFFVQINGMPQGMTQEEYKRKIQKYITKETIILGEVKSNPELENLIRRSVFREKVDYGMIMESEEYKYGIYSERTQQTIVEKAEELLEMDWVVGQVRNIEYIILETVFSLPPEVVQKQHAYTYTEDAPKVIYMGSSSNTEGVGLRESIVMMFLLLCGWDILVVSPAGYRYTERYIQRDIMDVIELGPYNFNIEWEQSDMQVKESTTESESIFGLIKNIFKK